MDQLLQTRIQNGTVDVGAYEYYANTTHYMSVLNTTEYACQNFTVNVTNVDQFGFVARAQPSYIRFERYLLFFKEKRKIN